jgi:phosphatidylserine/phosphatidylglycerophosphate/cardiolipin synthase-like enzyme
MRGRASKDGLTLRVIAGTNNVILAMDLTEAKRQGCLGFSIERTDIETGDQRWLSNMLRFPSDNHVSDYLTTARAPLQKFRWGDYTLEPGRRFRYRVVARYGKVSDVISKGWDAEQRRLFDTIGGGVTVEVRTENNRLPTDTNTLPTDTNTGVFFNRGAAASEAYVRRFGKNDPAKVPDAKVWLSRGLEEALISFIGSAKDSDFALHAAIYEFQKPELLNALKTAQDRGVDVHVAYHAREKGGKDHTAAKNEAAIKAAHINFAKPRRANPQNAIMHNKFVVLLQKRKPIAQEGKPIAVWTGSTNWTEGAIYGQLNHGHAIYDEGIAKKYEKYFQWLWADKAAAAMKEENEALTPVPADPQSIHHGITPIFSPQSSLEMIELYAAICANAKVLLLSAPFTLHKKIRDALHQAPEDTLRFMMADKEGSFGKKGEMELMQRDPGNKATVATMLHTPLHDFQGKLLEHAESFHHKGVHVHSKLIASNPFSDPILVTGSANFSDDSTRVNDSNTLVIRGDTATMDIYATEFMRMFEQYWFRAHISGATKGGAKKKTEQERLRGLHEDATWSDPFYVAGSSEMRDRLSFAGIVT